MYLVEAATLAGSGNQGTQATQATQGQSTATQQTTQATDTGFKMPDKFASAKPEDIAKAYVELEKKYGETSAKVGTLSEYEKWGAPKDVGEAIQWARDTYSKIQRGELTPKQAQQQAEQRQQQQTQQPSAPWAADNWAYLPPEEQAAKMAEYSGQTVEARVMATVNKLAEQYAGQIQQMNAGRQREQSLMFKAIETYLANGGKGDLSKVLETAAEMATKPPEEFIQMAMQQMVNPEAQKAQIEAEVTKRVAEALQKANNDNLADLTRTTGSAVPRFATKVFNNRNDENRAIIESWGKNGIRP